MSVQSFILEISYSQFAVFNPQVKNPFNEWTDDHVKQGFSWRDDSACFRTLTESGESSFQISYHAVLPDLYPSAIRAILVPVPKLHDKKLEIASLGDNKIITMPFMINGLLIQFSPPSSNEPASVMVGLLSGFPVDFAILRADSEIKKTTSLLKRARPAD
jgi:hypothetical protein